jgi:hypothetical protein
MKLPDTLLREVEFSCERCEVKVPIPIVMTMTRCDHDPTLIHVHVEPDMVDLWAHVWTHEEQP